MNLFKYMVMPLVFIISILSKKHGAPPPVLITMFCWASMLLIKFRSKFLKYASPFCSKISLTLMPSLSSINLSKSIQSYCKSGARCRPTYDLPQPIKPTKKINHEFRNEHQNIASQPSKTVEKSTEILENPAEEYSADYVIVNGKKIYNEEEAIDITKEAFQLFASNVTKTINQAEPIKNLSINF